MGTYKERRLTFTEVIFSTDPDREKLPECSPYSIIDHPFRVLVHDSEGHLVAVATAALGPMGNVLAHARAWVEWWPHYASAIVLSRTDLVVLDTFVKPIGATHASPQHPR